MSELLEIAVFLAGSAFGGLLFAAVAACAYLAVHVWCPTERVSLRAAATVALSGWLLVTAGYAGLALGIFSRPFAAALTLVFAAVAFGIQRSAAVGLSRALAADIVEAWTFWRSRSRAIHVVAGGAVALFLWRLAGSLSSPPVRWDVLTYHLVRAGDWVRTGGWHERALPDAWTYYAYFRDAGDLLSAWAMLPTHTDVWIPLLSSFPFFAIALAAYALLRRLGLNADDGVLGAAAISMVPAIWDSSATAMIDHVLACWMVVGFAAAAQVRDARGTGWVFIAAASFGLAAATKFSGIVLLGTGMLALAWNVVANTDLSRVRAVGVAFVGLVAMTPPYVRPWIEVGNPFYPFRIAVGPWVVSEGNDLFNRMSAGKLEGMPQPEGGAFEFLVDLVTIPANFGFGAVPFAACALIGIAFIWRNPQRGVLIGVALAGTVFLAVFLSDGMSSQRSFWVHVVGRLLFPTFVALVVLGALPERPSVRWLWRAGVGLTVATCVYTVAVPVTSHNLGPTFELLAVFGATGVFVVFATRWLRSGRRIACIAAFVAAGVVFTVGTFLVERANRWKAYEGRGFHALFEFVDRYPGRIAVTAGDSLVGHNWFIYPLFGATLQNDVIYVSPTKSGAPLSPLEAGPLPDACPVP